MFIIQERVVLFWLHTCRLCCLALGAEKLQITLRYFFHCFTLSLVRKTWQGWGWFHATYSTEVEPVYNLVKALSYVVGTPVCHWCTMSCWGRWKQSCWTIWSIYHLMLYKPGVQSCTYIFPRAWWRWWDGSHLHVVVTIPAVILLSSCCGLQSMLDRMARVMCFLRCVKVEHLDSWQCDGVCHSFGGKPPYDRIKSWFCQLVWARGHQGQLSPLLSNVVVQE